MTKPNLEARISRIEALLARSEHFRCLVEGDARDAAAERAHSASTPAMIAALDDAALGLLFRHQNANRLADLLEGLDDDERVHAAASRNARYPAALEIRAVNAAELAGELPKLVRLSLRSGSIDRGYVQIDLTKREAEELRAAGYRCSAIEPNEGPGRSSAWMCRSLSFEERGAGSVHTLPVEALALLRQHDPDLRERLSSGEILITDAPLDECRAEFLRRRKEAAR